MPLTDAHHGALILGGGSALTSVVQRSERAGGDDDALHGSCATHYYQPLWTLTASGRASIAGSARPEARGYSNLMIEGRA